MFRYLLLPTFKQKNRKTNLAAFPFRPDKMPRLPITRVNCVEFGFARLRTSDRGALGLWIQ